MNPQYVTFRELSEWWGRRPAIALLLCIERLAQIKHEIASIDMDARFQAAMQALSDTDIA